MADEVSTYRSRLNPADAFQRQSFHKKRLILGLVLLTLLFAVVVEDYQKNPTFYESLSAVKNDKVYSQLPYNYYSTNIDTAIAGAYYLGKILYPAAFTDVDPAEKADEVYQALLGQPVYAQMAEAFGGFGELTLSEQ